MNKIIKKIGIRVGRDRSRYITNELKKIGVYPKTICEWYVLPRCKEVLKFLRREDIKKEVVFRYTVKEYE